MKVLNQNKPIFSFTRNILKYLITIQIKFSIKMQHFKNVNEVHYFFSFLLSFFSLISMISFAWKEIRWALSNLESMSSFHDYILVFIHVNICISEKYLRLIRMKLDLIIMFINHRTISTILACYISSRIVSNAQKIKGVHKKSNEKLSMFS